MADTEETTPEVTEDEEEYPYDENEIEVISDDDGNEIIRVTASGTVVDWEEETEDEEEENVPEAEAGSEDNAPAIHEEPPVEPRESDAEPVQRQDDSHPEDRQAEVQQFAGFSIRADGLGLYEPAFEDANSPEAEALIYGEIDEETGETISEGIGEREYARRAGAYQVAQYQYGQNKEREIHSSIQTGVSAIQGEVNSLYDTIAAEYEVSVDEAKAFEPVLQLALSLIDEDRKSRFEAYAQAGYDAQAAMLLANRDVLSYPNIFQMKFEQASVKMRKEVDAIKKSWWTREKSEPAKAKEVKVDPIAERLTPPQTSTSTATPAAKPSSTATPRRDLRTIPKAALEIAKMTGVDPWKLVN